jgi:SAM-dependent methyltransferase
VESFSADWLSLRESFDRTARSRPLARAFIDALPRNGLVADLGCGCGANAAYLSEIGRSDLRWLLVDGDSTLLSAARERLRRAQTVRADLARLDAMTAVDACDGVTAAALCDLVSGEWVDRIVRRAARRRLPILLVLSVDGRVALSPAIDDDADLLAVFRRDQRRDKGFGPALGGHAPGAILRAMRRHGYRSVSAARSDWKLRPDDVTMLKATVGGIAAVAGRKGEPWLKRRQALIDTGRLAMTVGHVDILALPGGAQRFAGMAGGSRGVTLL